MVELMADIHGLEYAIIVPHNIIGPRQRPADSFRNVAAIFINRMLQSKQPLFSGDREQKRCFTFIQDDICPLRKLVTYNNVTGEDINIGPDAKVETINRNDRGHPRVRSQPIYERERPHEVKLATTLQTKPETCEVIKPDTHSEKG